MAKILKKNERIFFYKTYYEIYSNVRKSGRNEDDAKIVAWMEFQSFVINLIHADQTIIADILRYYTKLKNDTKLHQKMERQYVLFNRH